MAGITTTPEGVIAELERCKGNVKATARKLGTSRVNLFLYIRDHPEVRSALDSIREGTIDDAEVMLQTRMKKSDALLIFFLKTQGHKRGYVERHEVTGADGNDLTIRVVYGERTDRTDQPP